MSHTTVVQIIWPHHEEMPLSTTGAKTSDMSFGSSHVWSMVVIYCNGKAESAVPHQVTGTQL